MGIKSFLKQGMAYGLDRQYEKKCASRKILYKDWVASMEEAEAGADGSRTEAASEKPGTGAGAPSSGERAEADRRYPFHCGEHINARAQKLALFILHAHARHSYADHLAYVIKRT